MIASVHILTSAALSKTIDSIYVLPFASLALHFLIDAVPHYDYKPFEKIGRAKSVFFLALDMAVGFFALFLFAYFAHWNFTDYYAAFVAVFFGLLPDILSKIFKLFILKQNKYALAFRSFHKKLHLVFIDHFIEDFHKGFYQQILVSILAAGVIIYKS